MLANRAKICLFALFSLRGAPNLEILLAMYLADIYLEAMAKNGGTTSNAVLGLLSLGPMSGYDIRQLISRSIGHFWSESYGQIYPGLKRLAAAGLVSKKTERKKGSPDRHVYSLTAEGREQLRKWLKLPVVAEVPRNELLLKLFFGACVPPRVNHEYVQTYLESHQKELQVYAAIEKTLRKEKKNDPQLPFCLMTLSMGRHRSAAMVKWCKETLAELDGIERRQKGGT
jgi:PadR family transcriptional regulator, regulatory protein AphA